MIVLQLLLESVTKSISVRNIFLLPQLYLFHSTLNPKKERTQASNFHQFPSFDSLFSQNSIAKAARIATNGAMSGNSNVGIFLFKNYLFYLKNSAFQLAGLHLTFLMWYANFFNLRIKCCPD